MKIKGNCETWAIGETGSGTSHFYVDPDTGAQYTTLYDAVYSIAYDTARMSGDDEAAAEAFAAAEASAAQANHDAANELLDDVSEILWAAGDSFSGGDRRTCRQLAAEWVDAEFDANDVDAWTDAGVWDADTAVVFRDAGLDAADAIAASAALVGASEDPEAEYTCGDPIYAICNGDISPDVLIDAHAAR